MKRTLLITSFILSMTTLGVAQVETTDLESFNLEIDTFLNGSDFSGGFSENRIFLPNSYEDTYGSWSGWSISTMTDNTTAGFTNQYACISGSGANGSSHYATSFVGGGSYMLIEGDIIPQKISINNSTYAYLSMLNGDSFAKKFGGESGDDPDFFLLTIKAYSNGQLKADSLDFYLADYRATDNSLDYIIDEWTEIDLSLFLRSDSLTFNLSSSDNGAFGMNTPSYFCADDIIIDDILYSQDNIHSTTTNLYPNPTVDMLQIESTTLRNGQLTIYNQQGQVIKAIGKYNITDEIDVRALPHGQYYMEIKADDNTRWVDSFIKN